MSDGQRHGCEQPIGGVVAYHLILGPASLGQTTVTCPYLVANLDRMYDSEPLPSVRLHVFS